MSGTEPTARGESEEEFRLWMSRAVEVVRRYEPALDLSMAPQGHLTADTVRAGADAFRAAISLYETGHLDGDAAAVWIFLAMGAPHP